MPQHQQKSFLQGNRGNRLNLRNISAAAVVLASGVFLAACAPETPSPNAATGTAPAGINPAANAERQPTTNAARKRYLIVQRGQSLGRIAETYHVAAQVIIAANKLSPPYRLKAGARLLLPAPAVAIEPTPHGAAHAEPARSSSARPNAAVPSSRSTLRHRPPDVSPLDDGPATKTTSASATPSATAPPAQPSLQLAPARRAREKQQEIPLDDPPSVQEGRD